jgi:hypothetical protein
MSWAAVLRHAASLQQQQHESPLSSASIPILTLPQRWLLSRLARAAEESSRGMQQFSPGARVRVCACARVHVCACARVRVCACARECMCVVCAFVVRVFVVRVFVVYVHMCVCVARLGTSTPL